MTISGFLIGAYTAPEVDSKLEPITVDPETNDLLEYFPSDKCFLECFDDQGQLQAFRTDCIVGLSDNPVAILTVFEGSPITSFELGEPYEVIRTKLKELGFHFSPR